MRGITQKIFKTEAWKNASAEERGMWISLYALSERLGLNGAIPMSGSILQEASLDNIKQFNKDLIFIKGDTVHVNRFNKKSKVSLKEAEEVYSLYPKKVGRPAAIKSIQVAIENYGLELITTRTKLYAKSREGESKQYTPHPSTWFNQERFNDDPSTWSENEDDGKGKSPFFI